MSVDILLSDQIRVREIIERYFSGVDAQDESSLISCFSDDAIADYHYGTPEQRTVVSGVAIARDVHASCSRFAASNHSLSNFVVDLSGDAAKACTFAVAHVAVENRVLVRGLRYQDHLIKNSKGWQISRRVHSPLWQFEAEAVTPFLSTVFSNSQ